MNTFRLNSIGKPLNCLHGIVALVIDKLLGAAGRVEEALLALLLSGMIGVAASQVMLRNFFDSGLYWGDSAVRVMVLWVALLGAMVASRKDEHIRIDIAGRYLPAFMQPFVSRVVSLFTCLVLVVFSWYSAEFVLYEYADGTLAFGVVPAWLCEIIMPLGSGVMAMRYALLTVRPLPRKYEHPENFSTREPPG